MKALATCRLAALLIAALTWLTSLLVASAANGQPPFADAVAVWHMAEAHDSAGANSVLKVADQVKLGIELQGAEREASLIRGGDGKVAELTGGWLNPGLGAGGELNLRGQAMTLCIRLRDPSGQWGRGIFSKYGAGHDALAYNLFSTTLSGDDAGPDIGFELGTAPGNGMVQVKTSVGQLVDPAAWHDLIGRYDGRLLEMFVDGVRIDQRPANGELRQNEEACIVGGYSVGGKVPNPFHGQIDHAALWQRAITDDEIVKLSGGQEFVAKQKELIAKRKRQVSQLAPEVEDFRSVLYSKDVAEYSKATLTFRKWMIANDPLRPLYHFTGPESWINDPNGPIFYQGQYHLFYQYRPVTADRPNPRTTGGGHSWGHAASNDLVHWTDWPVAMWPDIPQDRNGAGSGNTFHLGDYWELPYLIPLGGRHVLMVGAGNPYWVGTYDTKTMLFTPDRAEPRAMDTPCYYSFNPNMVDDKGPGGAPRRIMHGWVKTDPTPTGKVPYWQGAHSIPRVITLKDGRVWQEPIPELQTLRADKQSFKNLDITPESGDLLKTVKGDSLEIIATFKPGTAQRFGIKVRSSATDANVNVSVWINPRELTFGAAQGSMASDLKPGDPVTLHVFVDRSVVEGYLNGNASTAVCGHDPAAQGVELFAQGGSCTLESLDVWRLRSAWD
ncbi:MAG: GH32 C-terminal domain-containing protein [Verrucomicrobia bacterium]|nr:GH32 C-terminal domain-containing protein [Verrucomicrobiota bacterium]